MNGIYFHPHYFPYYPPHLLLICSSHNVYTYTYTRRLRRNSYSLFGMFNKRITGIQVIVYYNTSFSFLELCIFIIVFYISVCVYF